MINTHQNDDKPKATVSTGMESTMHDIDMQDNPNPRSKRDMMRDISKLETEIKTAQEGVDVANEARTSYTTTVSPEQANARQKAIVFLKKALEEMKTEFEKLSF
ncbi:MAG TPA: hypothetical protein VF974_06485 [Patescibacteria group bacterium]